MNNGYTVLWRVEDELKVSFFNTRSGLEEWLRKDPYLEDVCQGNGLRETTYGDLEAVIAGRHSNFPEKSFLVIGGTPLKLKKKQVTVLYEVP